MGGEALGGLWGPSGGVENLVREFFAAGFSTAPWGARAGGGGEFLRLPFFMGLLENLYAPLEICRGNFCA